MRQSAYLVVNPVMADNYASFFNCTPMSRASDSTFAPTLSYSLKLVGAGASYLLLGPPRFNWCFSFAAMLFGAQGFSIAGYLIVSVSPCF